MKFYAYCLCADLETFAPTVSGVSGTAVRILKVDDISVVFSDCETVPATHENMLAHAAVVRSVFEQTTTMPFRFGTLATEQQLRRFVSGHKAAIAKKLEHLRGRVEMDLKIVWQHRTSQPNQPEEDAGPGTAFLRQKRRELLGDDQALAQRKELSSLLREDLGDLIKEEEMNFQPSETEVLGKVFHLVERMEIQAYRERIASVPGKRPEIVIEVSGPWPPYSFANIELEFGSQFGVS